MKISFSKESLIAGISPVLGAVPTNGTLVYTNGILLETAENNEVYITAYDTGKGIRSRIQAEFIHEGGSYIFNAQKLFQIVKLMPDGLNIDITVDENRNVEIKSGKSSFSLFAIPGSEFPRLPDLGGKRGFNIAGGVLRKMIGKVIHSVAEQDSRPMLCGAFFRISSDRLHVVSCDSYTLSRCSVKCDISSLSANSELDFSFIIPGHALSELSKNLAEGDEENVEFYISRKHAIVKKGDSVFFTRTIDSEYIDYKRIIPKDNDITVIVDKERFLDGLERANIVADEKIKGSTRSYVKIATDDQFLSISSSSVNGNVFDEMECVHEGKDIEIGFNCRYLINSVKVAEGENIKITLKSPTQAITIEPTEEDDDFKYFYMILPVRMNEQK